MNKSSQQGSAIFYILIAIALFAALSFAVSNMMRSGDASLIGEEKAGLEAGRVLDYARSVKEAVQELRIANGCADGEISFERSPFDGSDTAYDNPSSPSDFSCHVFHADGGGLSPQENFEGRDWIFTGAFYVDKLGTGAQELSATLIVKKAVCEALNNHLSVSNADIENGVDDEANGSNELPAFKGTFSGNGEILMTPYAGKAAGCYKSLMAADGEYTFYQALIVR